MRLPSLALGLLLSLPAGGATYDPDLTWRTIVTEHFRIHFHQGEEQLAEEFSTTVESVYDTMVDEMRWKPRRRTHVVLIDRTDDANGFAGSVPYNAITIFVTGPTEHSTLGQYEDWLTAIQTHEFTHTLHIDTNHGVARAARWVVGRVSSTNRLSPPWMVEGLATFQETRHTNGGRGRTPLVQMILRTAALEDDIPPLGRMDGFQAPLPGGQIRYLFGRDFIQHVADHHGEDVWTKWVHTYGASVPYLLPGRYVLGAPLGKLHRAWADDLRSESEAVVQRIAEDGPVTQARLISGPDTSCTAPTFSPTGDTLIWSCLDIRLGSQIWRSNGEGEEVEKVVQDRGASSFTWRRDGKAFAYAGTHVVNRFNTWSDVYLYDVEADRVQALTSGARARDPDFSPDGSRLLVVTNRAQDNQLAVMTVDRQTETLTDFEDHTQLSTPRHSPDGSVLAASVWRDGRRDLWLLAPDGRFLRRLTTDDAIDRDPRWSADGRWLYFASDRTGIPQVFAIDVQTERLWQVTNVPTGAVAPSPHPSGERIAWQEYHARGWRVAIADIDRSTWIDRGTLTPPLRHGTAIAELLSTPPEAPEAAPAPSLDLAPTAAPPAEPAPDDPLPDHFLDPSWSGGAPARRRHGVPVDPLVELPGALSLLPHRTRGLLPRGALPQDDSGIDSFDQANVEDAFGEEEDYPFTIEPRRYRPLSPLLPRYWVPFVQTSVFPARAPFDFLPNKTAVIASASTGSVDPLRHYAWSASASYRTDANFLSAGASFTLNRWIPIYNVGVARTATTPTQFVIVHPDEPTREDGSPNYVYNGVRYWQKRHTVAASINYPYTFKTWIFARYELSFRDDLDPLPADIVPEFLPVRGAIGTIQGGWRYSWSQQTRTAISTEDGRIVSVVGGLIHPWLGAYSLDVDGNRDGLTAAQLTAELREYRSLPWSANHVLALRLAGGGTVGSDRFLGLYQLGGSFGESSFYVQPSSSRMLRGYDVGADVGDVYWLGSLEYRMPVVRFDRGIGTWPVFFSALSARAFVDAGNAFTDPSRWSDTVDGTLVGVGAELRLTGVLWYGVGTSVRAGIATGLTGDGIGFVTDEGKLDPRVGYLRFGGTF